MRDFDDDIHELEADLQRLLSDSSELDAEEFKKEYDFDKLSPGGQFLCQATVSLVMAKWLYYRVGDNPGLFFVIHDFFSPDDIKAYYKAFGCLIALKGEVEELTIADLNILARAEFFFRWVEERLKAHENNAE